MFFSNMNIVSLFKSMKPVLYISLMCVCFVVNVYGQKAMFNSGNKIVLSSTSSVSVGAASNFGTSLNFDGSNDYVALPTSSNIPIGNAVYTIEALIKPTVHATNGIMGWGSFGSGNQVNALRLSSGNIIYNYWWGNDLSINTTTTLADNLWHHVAATFDGSTRKIYVDGVLKGQDSPSGHNVPNTANFRIGSTNLGEYFNGNIDEVRIWNVARSAADILSAMNSTLIGNEAGLVAYYNFDEGVAAGSNSGITTVIDKTSFGNNGTLMNFSKSGSASNYVTGKVN